MYIEIPIFLGSLLMGGQAYTDKRKAFDALRKFLESAKTVERVSFRTWKVNRRYTVKVETY